MRFLNGGESHGRTLVGIIEGMPANIPIDREMIDTYLKLRQGGYGRGGRMQIETDQVDIVSGVRGGLTTGAPISFLIANKDWENWEKVMAAGPEAELESRQVTRARPGHADYPGAVKYRQRDIRNVLERASARETASRVAMGAFALNLLAQFEIHMQAYVVGIGPLRAEMDNPEKVAAYDFATLYDTPLYCPDPEATKRMIALIDEAKSRGESLGGEVEVRITGLPVGLGSYVNPDRKLDARIAGAVMGIQAIKGVEIGLGFAAAHRFGSQVHDEIFYCPERGLWHGSNNAGGIEGGMTNGEDVIVRAAMKPIPTLYSPLRSIDLFTGEAYEAAIERSDICAVPAAAIVTGCVVAWEVACAFLDKFGGDSLEEIRANYENWREMSRGFIGGEGR